MQSSSAASAKEPYLAAASKAESACTGGSLVAINCCSSVDVGLLYELEDAVF